MAFTIRVKTLAPATHQLTVDPQSLVTELKDRLVELTGVLPEQQRLLYSGSALQDGQRLSDCGIQDGHTIHLVERPAGSANAPPQQQPQQQPGGATAGDTTWAHLNTLMSGIFSSATAAAGQPVNVRIQTGAGMMAGGLDGAALQDAAAFFGLGMPHQAGVAQQSAQGRQGAATAAAPGRMLLSTLHQYTNNLRADAPGAWTLHPSTSYVIPEARRLDNERRWYAAAQQVLANAQLPEDVRQFVNMATAAAVGARDAGTRRTTGSTATGNSQAQPAGRQQQGATRQNLQLASVVAVAAGQLLQQTAALWQQRSAPALEQAATQLSSIASAAQPSAEAAAGQLQAAGTQLYSMAALTWELARLCAALVPALRGTAQLPLANGRLAFINADGSAPVMPFGPQARGQTLFSGPTGAAGAPSNDMTPVSVRLPNGAMATGYFSGEPPSQQEFLQQLQFVMGSHFGLAPQVVASGGQQAQQPIGSNRGQAAGRQPHAQQQPSRPTPGARPVANTASTVQAHQPARQTPTADSMPSLVPMDGSSDAADNDASASDADYETDWVEDDGGDDNLAEGAAERPRLHRASAGTQTSTPSAAAPVSVPLAGNRSPSISISFDSQGQQQIDISSMWPFIGGMVGPAGGNPWQDILNMVQQPAQGRAASASRQQGHPATGLNPADVGASASGAAAPTGFEGALQDQLRNLIADLLQPVIARLAWQPQATGPGAPDLAQSLGTQIAASLQPYLGTIQRVVSMLTAEHAAQWGAGAAAARPDQRRAAAPTSETAATGGAAAEQGVARAGGSSTGLDGQQWAHVPTTSISAEFTVEPIMQVRGRSGSQAPGVAEATSSAAAQPPTAQHVGGQQPQSSNPMAELSAAMPAIQQALATAGAGPPTNSSRSHRPQQGPLLTAGIGAGDPPSLAAATSEQPRSTSAAAAAGQPAGMGGMALPRPQRNRPQGSTLRQQAAADGLGLGLPPRTTPARAASGSFAGDAEPGRGAAAATQAQLSGVSATDANIGSMMAAMLGGMGGGSGAADSSGAHGGTTSSWAAGGGGLASMLQSFAQSPAIHQMASDPSLQNAMRPMIDGARSGNGQVDFGAIMGQMMPMVTQLLGGGGGGGAMGPDQTRSAAPAAAAGPAPSAAASSQAEAAAAAEQAPPAAFDDLKEEQALLEQHLDEAGVGRWLEVMRRDAAHMRGSPSNARPLSAAYTAGSLHPPSSSQRLF